MGRIIFITYIHMYIHTHGFEYPIYVLIYSHLCILTCIFYIFYKKNIKLKKELWKKKQSDLALALKICKIHVKISENILLKTSTYL